MVRSLACTLIISLTLPHTGSAWQADNRHTVNALPQGGFEVIGEPGSAGPDYWCAAGDYAIRVLGVAGTQRIYLTRGRAAPETSNRKSGVQFSLTAPAAAVQTSGPFLPMRKVGDNLSAVFARNYCLDNKNLEF